VWVAGHALTSALVWQYGLLTAVPTLTSSPVLNAVRAEMPAVLTLFTLTAVSQTLCCSTFRLSLRVLSANRVPQETAAEGMNDENTV